MYTPKEYHLLKNMLIEAEYGWLAPGGYDRWVFIEDPDFKLHLLNIEANKSFSNAPSTIELTYKVYNLLFNTDLKNIPLYINEASKPVVVVAKWRLSIGK